MLSNGKYFTVTNIAGGGACILICQLIYTHIYVQKKIQTKIREFSHYRGAFTVLSKHRKAMDFLGLPLTVGEVDLVDRKRNYIDGRMSQLRIPICGERDGGIMVVRAERDEDGEDFETAQIELELDEAGHNIWPSWLQPYVEVLLLWISWAIDYVDWDYLEYLTWLFLPLLIAFVLPVLLLFFIYGCVIFLHIYGLRNRIREAYASSLWDGARISIASFWDAVGYVWHGYEIKGLENVPNEGSALFVYYHGTLPIDVYYVIAKCMLHKKRTLHCVGDKFIFKMPGWGMICKVFYITPGTVDDCMARLKDGHLLCIAPGGVREALFSDPTRYNIMWARRLGFAKVIIGCPGTPVIPMFTENCRDAFRTPRCGRKVFRWIYEKTRLPLCPVYGGFPVKMITHLGRPVYFSSDMNPEDVKKTVKAEVHDLIREHQRLPGSILRGIMQRFYDKRRYKEDILLEEIACNNLCSNNNTHSNSIVSSEFGQLSPAKILISHADSGVPLDIN
uniref:PlsC domain-containing protein n=1 Tax=Loa loa TaxID=7209 RepID=A0A1I7VVU2_LOALO